MTRFATDSALRRALLIDAGASGALGVLLALGAGPLEPVLGLSEGLLRGVGLFLIPFAAFLTWLAPRAGAFRGLVRLVVVGNVLWVVASIALLVSGWVSPTVLGTLFVGAQAAAVAMFAYIEHRAATRDDIGGVTASSAAGR